MWHKIAVVFGPGQGGKSVTPMNPQNICLKLLLKQNTSQSNENQSFDERLLIEDNSEHGTWAATGNYKSELANFWLQGLIHGLREMRYTDSACLQKVRNAWIFPKRQSQARGKQRQPCRCPNSFSRKTGAEEETKGETKGTITPLHKASVLHYFEENNSVLAQRRCRMSSINGLETVGGQCISPLKQIVGRNRKGGQMAHIASAIVTSLQRSA